VLCFIRGKTAGRVFGKENGKNVNFLPSPTPRKKIAATQGSAQRGGRAKGIGVKGPVGGEKDSGVERMVGCGCRESLGAGEPGSPAKEGFSRTGEKGSGRCALPDPGEGGGKKGWADFTVWSICLCAA